MIFVDTGAWFALLARHDPNHAAARTFFGGQRAEAFATTDFVLDELFTLLKVRGVANKIAPAGRLLVESRAGVHREWVTPADFGAAWEVFSRFRDKGWSFTDCSSLVVMRRLSIQTAFAFDDDFRQFGTVEVVP